MDNIKIIVLNEEIEIPKGMTLLDISKMYQDRFKYPIVLAKVNGQYLELSYKVDRPVDITFYDLTDRLGNRTYLSGLVFLTVFSVKELFGSSEDIVVAHSIDKGIYINTTFELTEAKLEELKNKMLEVVKLGFDITKLNVSRMEAMEYFEKIHDEPKAGIMKYNTNTYVTLYRLGNLYNYFYSYMPTNTSFLSHFELTYLNDHGFVLRYPTVYIHDKIKEYEHHPHMFDVFKECRDWAKVMGIENVVELNNVVSKGRIGDLIRIDETLQSNRLLQAAREIFNKKDRIKIILIAGPSSSGKTTMCNKLRMYLQSFGLNPKMISMDNYFVEREETPKNEQGEYDYESLKAIDLDLFNEQIEKLLNKEAVITPTYNFLLGAKQFKQELKLEENDILMIEGIHGLNREVLTNIPKENKYKIYISALTELNMDNHNRISTTDNRLLRRMVRDHRTRGYSVEETLKNWPNVRMGEEKYIFPYQDEADFTFNSALIYELGVLKTYVEPLLYSVEPDSAYYEEAKRLINFLRIFLPIPSEAIPGDSLLREFIGGSCFHD